MQQTDLRVLRGAAVPTAVVGVVLVLAAGVLAGGKAAVGALIGVLLVAAFFTAGMVVLAWAARINPVVLMNVAIATYVGKVLVLFLLLLAVQNTTLFDQRAFAFATIIAAIVWMVGEVRAFSRLKMLYVEPDRS